MAKYKIISTTYDKYKDIHDNKSWDKNVIYKVATDNGITQVFVQGSLIGSFYNDEEINNIVEKLEYLILENKDKTYTYKQQYASDEWFIQHNLNKMPSITIVDSGKNVVVGDIEYIDLNSLKIRFNGAFSGYAYLN